MQPPGPYARAAGAYSSARGAGAEPDAGSDPVELLPPSGQILGAANVVARISGLVIAAFTAGATSWDMRVLLGTGRGGAHTTCSAFSPEAFPPPEGARFFVAADVVAKPGGGFSVEPGGF
ncbi:hypothetical protein ACUN22_30750 [Streptomyces anulatus]|uniref:hypothetical protein n=1 Tax=Streptomyces anulatus TaxID=1892 RepID=UPI00403DE137